MSIISKTFTFTTGATIVAAEHNSNFDTIYQDYNGNITNLNISASANIADSKLAQITTAGKVSGTTFTNLANIPAGAGVIPAANLQAASQVNLTTGVVGVLPIANGGTNSTNAINTANGIVILDGSAKLPTVDGSQLTNLPNNSLSNVIFSTVFSNAKDSELPIVAYTTNSARSVAVFSFKKIAGISTLTLKAYGKVSATDAGNYVNFTVGGLTSENIVFTNSYATQTTTGLDVSSLTNGTVYDVTVTLTPHDQTTNLHSLTMIAS